MGEEGKGVLKGGGRRIRMIKGKGMLKGRGRRMKDG